MFGERKRLGRKLFGKKGLMSAAMSREGIEKRQSSPDNKQSRGQRERSEEREEVEVEEDRIGSRWKGRQKMVRQLATAELRGFLIGAGKNKRTGGFQQHQQKSELVRGAGGHIVRRMGAGQRQPTNQPA